MSRLRADDTIEARALEFMTLTAARPEDVIGYRAEKPALDWCEIDLDAKLWTLPAERAKTGTDHVVPLSGAAVAILEALPHRKGRVFNGAAYHGGLSENALLNKAQEVAAAMEGDHVTTARNLSRKTFRTWATDNRVEEEGIIELCLAHAVSEIRSSSTYYKGDAIDRKKHVFDAWAAFADGQSVGDNVVKLHA